VKLFSKYSNLGEKQAYLNVTGGQTERLWYSRALRSINLKLISREITFKVFQHM